MRKNGMAMAVLPETGNKFELVEVTDITPKSITVRIHNESRTYSHTVEEQGKWYMRGYLDFSNSKLINAE